MLKRVKFVGPALAAAALAAAPLAAHADGASVSFSGPLWNQVASARVAHTHGIMVREGSGIEIHIKARDLNPALPATISWAVFNEPGACQGAAPVAMCSPNDLGNPAVKADYIPSGLSFTVHHQGSAEIRAELATRSQGGPTGFLGTGLLNPLGSEVQVLVQQAGHTVEFAVFDPRPGDGNGSNDSGHNA